jgi:hypothetical protein
MVLLSRRLKRDPRKLILVAGLILVMRIVDLFWMLGPSFTGEHLNISWMDLVSVLAFGGLWLGTFGWQLGRRSLVPINDPQYEAVLDQVRAHAHANH